MDWLAGFWRSLGRLRWRISLAMTGMVFLTSVVIFVVTVASIGYYIDSVLESIKPSLSDALEKEFDRIEPTIRYDLDTTPELIVPFFIPILVGLVVALLLANRIAKPLEAISKAASAVAKGDLSARVKLNQRHANRQDETSQLARNFNAMAQDLENLEHERRVTTAAIAHELRTPITVLSTRLQAIKDGLIVVNDQEADVLLTQTALLTRLVEDLRTLSLAEAGRLNLEFTKVDFQVLLETILAGFAAKASQKNVQIISNLHPVQISADAIRLQQVVLNLLENALRHTPANSSIVVKLELAAKQAILEIHDSGAGIPTGSLPFIFERFYRAEHSRTRESGGSGLGLAIVKAIIEAHSGRVVASNHAGGGAVLQVMIPV